MQPLNDSSPHLSLPPSPPSLPHSLPPLQELDQIVAQYIQPMNDLVDSVASHRKFRRKPKEEVRGKEGRREGGREERK